MIAKDKVKQVQDLSDCIGKAKAGFLVHFQGINAQQITNMRKELKTKASEMKVFRNTLLKRTLETSPPSIKEHLAPHLAGPNAFVFAFDDPSATAKIVSHYVKATKALKIKAGIMEGSPMSAEDINTIANLPPLLVLKAQLVGVLSAPLRGLLSVLSALPTGFLRVVDQYGKKQKKEQ